MHERISVSMELSSRNPPPSPQARPVSAHMPARVLCCNLGCVLLYFLLASQQARSEEA